MLKVDTVSVQYGHRLVLKELSFSVEEGVTGILGPNGCGKTTLFRAISGQLTSLKGNILWNGTSLLNMKAKDRANILSLMPQETRMASGIPAIDFIEMGYYAGKPLFYMPGNQEHQEVRSLARQYACEHLLDSPMESLSTGECQLMMLLSVMVQDTPLVLLDEPSSSLDYPNTHRLLRYVHNLQKEKRKTILLILHDPTLALRYCDRILTLKDGQIQDVIFPQQESKEQIQNKLQRIYPGITILSHQGHYICY